MASDGKRGISIGQAATIVANLGVLIGLVFVIFELQQNRLNLQAEIELSIAASYQVAMGRTLENPVVAELMQTAFTQPDSLSDVQYVQLMSWNAEWMAVTYATHRLWRMGAISEETWLQHGSYFALFFQTEWIRDFWRATNAGIYPETFLQEFEALLPTVSNGNPQD